MYFLGIKVTYLFVTEQKINSSMFQSVMFVKIWGNKVRWEINQAYAMVSAYQKNHIVYKNISPVSRFVICTYYTFPTQNGPLCHWSLLAVGICLFLLHKSPGSLRESVHWPEWSLNKANKDAPLWSTANKKAVTTLLCTHRALHCILCGREASLPAAFSLLKWRFYENIFS